MLKNYLNIALRNLRRHKTYTFINVTGLAVGMACCLLILLFVKDELSYDRFHTNSDQIYRIQSDWGNFSLPSTSPPVLKNLTTDYPELTIAPLVRNQMLVTFEDQQFQEDGIFFTRPSFFDVFSFQLLQGNPETALIQPGTVLITPEVASRYFGEGEAIGQTMNFDNQYDLEVVGIIEAPPENAHFQYSILGSWATLDAAFDFSNISNWGRNVIYTYLLLPDGYAPETLEAQFPDFIERHAGSSWNGSELSLQALEDIHLHSHHNMELATNGSINNVYIFSVIALFILLVACVNFMNLATARSAERAREVGVRKAVGAQRGQLIMQFLSESMVLAVFALGLAILLAIIALPSFRALSGKALTIDILQDGSTLLLFLGLALGVGLFAGSYPAFILSAFRPVAVLKGSLTTSRRGAYLRKGLVVFQFATSMCLMVGTAVVYNQLDYLRNASLGFDKEQILVIPIQDDGIGAGFVPFRTALIQHPGLLNVSITSEGLPGELLNGSSTRLAALDADGELVNTRTVAIGHHFFETLGVEMLAGRSFSEQFPSDSSAFILNETAARLLQQTAPDRLDSLTSALGQDLQLGSQRGPLVGIAKDFNMSSLHEGIEPIIFFIRADWSNNFLLRVSTDDLRGTVAAVEEAWQTYFPSWPLEYHFADQGFDAQYRAEDRLGQLFTVFALLAILIACLGLFGLASFTAQQRTKEIGVRKVLGASVSQIVLLLSREFTALIVLAILVSVPVSYLVMERWLADFAYRITIPWWLFVAAGLSALLIALATVSYQSIKAAISDPVQALRYE